MYTVLDGRVRYSEADSSGAMSVKSVFDYLQDCCIFQSEKAGQGVNTLKEEHRAWLVAVWHLKFIRLPRLFEDIKVMTWPYKFREYFGYRCHSIETTDGEKLISGNSIWMFVNTDTGRPNKISQSQYDAYSLEDRLEMPFGSMHIKCRGDYTEGGSFKIHKYQLDTNGHTNNSQYVMMAADCLPDDFTYSEVKVVYKHEALLGDTVVSRLYTGEDKIDVELVSEDGKAFAVVEFTR